MKRLGILLACSFLGILAWRVGSRFSDDVWILMIGLVVGILAGIPSSLLVLAAGRRTQREAPDRAYHDYHQPQLPPVILYGGNHQQYQPQQQNQPVLPLPSHQSSKSEIEHVEWQ